MIPKGKFKMKTMKLVMVVVAVSLMLPWNSAFAYGGGGGGGGGASQTEDGFSGGGAVSWAPNPNGVDVIGSSIWSGRSENLEKGPYQPDKAAEDAEQDLLDGFKNGQYGADEVKANLEWAQGVGISISSEAQQMLDRINNPPKTPIKQKTEPAKSGQLTEKQQDKIVSYLNKYVQYNKTKDKFKQQGRKMTKTDAVIVVVKEEIKDFVPPEYKGYVDEAFDVFGY